MRRRVKQLTGRDSTSVSLGDKLREINPILRGWANYYRHCVGAGRVFVGIDWYVGLRLFCWLGKKRPKAGGASTLGLQTAQQSTPHQTALARGPVEQHMLGWTPVCRYRLAWMGTPDFAMFSGEPDAQRKAHVRFGDVKPAVARR
nr:group II intron maturase-specific domain-containing protein [Sinorhizobium meliloti]